jgi:hypothetical protein
MSRQLDAAPITQAVLEDAIELQLALARLGQHRMPISGRADLGGGSGG